MSTTAPEKPRGLVRTLTATGVGNAVEWFDWAIYATFASYIAGALFSKSDPQSAFLATLGIFAVGFVARPVGGFVFGWISDRRGRKFAMTLSVALASVGSLIIGLAPTYASIGAWASVILLVARLVQGLAHGGEMPSAQTYLSEVAPRERRGLWSSLIYVSGTAGTVFGALIGAVLASTLSAEQMGGFGWRLPFLLGAAFGLVGLIMRATMEETELFEAEIEPAVESPVVEKPHVLREMAAHWRQALQVVGLTVGLTVAFYVWSVSASAYAINVLGIDPAGALWAGVVANLVFIVSLPMWGRLSDRIGRRPVLVISGLGTAVTYFPATWFIRDAAWQLAVAMIVVLIFIGASAAIVPATYAELFPTSIRTVGVAVPYAIVVAAFGGTAAYLQAGATAWFGDQGPTAFGIYAIVLLLIGAVTAMFMPEFKGKDLSTQEQRTDQLIG